jgi:hypothetical protein
MNKIENSCLKSRFCGIILTAIVLFSAAYSYSQQGTSSGNNLHDSLLFDGTNKELSSDVCIPDTSNCIIIVYSLTGTATGTVMRDTMEDVSTCGPAEWEKVWHCEKRKLKIGDRLVPGETITTASGSFIDVMVRYPKGTYFETSISEKGRYHTDRVRYGPGTTFTPGCVKTLERGTIWIKDRVDEAGNKLNEVKDEIIESVKSKIKPKGTEFTIEVTDNEDIIRVYDGSVEVQLKKFDDSDIKKNSDEMNKLYDDYQSGKITMDEMMKKTKELTDKMQSGENNLKVSVTVEAGFMVKAGGKLSEVVPIPADDDKWWSDENFGK